jgi:lipid-binding SYLF domain-containing protein
MMNNLSKLSLINVVVALSLFLFWGCATTGDAPEPDLTAEEVSKLDTDAKATVDKFLSDTDGAEEAFASAKGILTCPAITKGGFIVGVESGKCVLTADGSENLYYGTSSLKGGLLAGYSKYSMLMLLNSDEALAKFTKEDKEWELGADASVAVIQTGASGAIDTTNLEKEIVTFIFSEEGLMGDVSFQGSRFKKLIVE